jgi:hypothetical protein
MTNKLTQTIAAMILVLLFLSACKPALSTPVTPTTTPISTPEAISTVIASREAQVQSIEIQLMNADPAQVNVLVRGKLTESCATLGESQVQYASNIFKITVYTNSPADIGCVQATTPFETTIPLNTKDRRSGTYTVIANGMSAVFTLPIENATPDPDPTLLVSVPTSSACVDSAAFITDVTIPDNSILDYGTTFTKTWRLKNTGSCTWDSSYLAAYISGATMSQQPGYWIVPQGQTVAPGQTVDVSVGMTAPVDNGNYVSYWGLKKVDGPFMPIRGGANGNSFYVKLTVNNGRANGNVTAVSIDIEPEQGSGPVCTANSTYFVNAAITSDGPTTATYEIGSTAGQMPAGNFQNLDNNGLSPFITGAVAFDQAGTKQVNLRFVGPYPYPGDITVNLRVNGGEWHNTKLSCQ